MGRGRDGHEGKFFLWDGYSIMRMSSDLIWIELERENGEGNGSPLQYSCLENPMDGGAWGCSPWGGKESDMTEQLHFDFSLSCIGEGNGNPPQYSCLENPRDVGAWWAAVYGVAQSRTRLSDWTELNKCWWEYRRTRLFIHCWGDYRMVLMPL